MILFVLGILCCSISLFFLIIYLNLFTIGYTFQDYVYFIIRRGECNLLWVGIFLLFLLFRKKARKK